MQMTSDRAERQPNAWWTDNPLAVGLAFSLLVHISLYGGWRMALRYGWDKSPMPKWLQKLASATRPHLNKIEQKLDPKTAATAQEQPPEEREPQLIFIEVDPLKAIAEAPKDAKYYSAVSTKAANPEQSNKSDVQVDGNQSRVAKILESQPKLSLATPKVDEPEPAPAKPAPVAVDKPKQEPEPLQPVQKSVEKPKETLVENQPRPKGGKTFGDLAMAKPTTRPDLTGPDDGQEKPTATAQTETPWKRPRTLRDAYSQKGRTGSPGEKLKQAGGVSVQDDIRFDVKGSKFGDYDGRLIDAIRQCWYNDLESLPSQSFPKGDVVVDFVLHYNGKVTDVNISHDGVGNFYSFLSQGAIKKAAPFEPWPQEIRRAVGQDIREIRFTFIYY